MAGGLPQNILDRQNAAIGLGFVEGDPKNVYVLELEPWSIAGAALSTIYASDTGYTTSASDTPANVVMESRFLVVPNITTTLYDPSGNGENEALWGLPGLGNFARPSINEAKILNVDTDPATGTGPLDKYLDRSLWSFNGRKAWLKVGAEDLAYTAFVTVTDGALIIDGEPTWDAKGNLVFRFEAPMARYSEPFNVNTYGGWGAAVVLDGSTTSISLGNEWNIGEQDTTLEWFGSWDDLASLQIWMQKRATVAGATDAGISVRVTAGDVLTFDASDGVSSGAIAMGAANAYGDEVRRLFSLVFDQDGNVTAYVTVKDSDGEPLATSLGTLDISSWGSIQNSEPFVIGSNPGVSANFLDGTLAEFRVWRKARSKVEIEGTGLHALTGSEDFLVALYRFNDRTKTALAYNDVAWTGLVSLEFDASTEEVDHGANYEKIASDDFTVGRWFKTTDAIVGSDVIMGNRTQLANTNPGYNFYITADGTIHASVCDSSTNLATADSTTDYWADGTWHFIGIRVDRTADTCEAFGLRTRSSGTVETYSIDATAVGSLVSGNNLILGRCPAGARPFEGRTGHGFHVNVAATDAQILGMARYLYGTDNISEPYTANSAKNANSSFWNQDEDTLLDVADSWGSVDGTIDATGPTWTNQDGVMSGSITWVPTYEGDEGPGRLTDDSLRGLQKLEIFGRCRSVPLPVVGDAGDFAAGSKPIYHLSDPEWVDIKAVDALYSEGLVLTDQGGSPDFAVDLTNNAATFTAPQDGLVTADLQGDKDGSGDLIERTADIFNALATQTGETVNAASITALNTSYPYSIGLGITHAPHLGGEVYEACLRSSCYGYLDADGEVVLGRYENLDGATATFALTTANIKKDGVRILYDIPAAKAVTLLYQKNVQPLDSFLPAVNPPEQERQHRQFRRVNSPIAGISKKHKAAVPLVVASLIHRKADAQVEADRLAAIYGRQMYVLRVQLAADLFQASIGDTVQLTHPRYGFGSGKNFLCIGTQYPKTPSLDLWGPFTL